MSEARAYYWQAGVSLEELAGRLLAGALRGRLFAECPRCGAVDRVGGDGRCSNCGAEDPGAEAVAL